MNKKCSKKLFAILLSGFFTLTTFNFNVNAKDNFKRLSGSNRYETSVEIAKDGWENSDCAIIASGEGFADALSAAPLAEKYKAPILLNPSNKLETKIKEELLKLKTKRAIIIGGNASISQNVENEINRLNIVTRRIYGKDRFDTSVKVAKEIGTANGIVITNGLAYPDALSIASVAANKQMPILLTNKDKLPLQVKDFIEKGNYNKSYIIGGTGVISEGIEKNLKNSKRIYGSDRYNTNAKILKEFFNKKELENIYVTSGSNYPDALSGSALSVKTNSPIMIVSNSLEASQIEYLKSCKLKNVIALGGKAVVSDILIETIHNYNVISIGELKVHYINVGQGDSILIQQGDYNMLIDAGTNSCEKTVVNYLRNLGIKKLDYVIGTHPHEDHIGGLDAVINSFDIGKVIMPKVTANTKTFKDVITAVINKGLKLTEPKVGDNYNLGKSTWTIVAPNNVKYNNTNNYSVVTKFKFGKNTFIFTGDAANISEEEMLSKQLDITADVLKVGHHGSRTSTSEAFLDKVNPKYAVISCGKANKYGHPTQETLNRLKNKNVKIYRTDESGSIVATANGENIKFDCVVNNVVNNSSTDTNTDKAKVNAKPENTNIKLEEVVYVTKSGKHYHHNGCRSLIKSDTSMLVADALKHGYTPCKVCN